MYVANPSASAFLVNVPITSSASHPGSRKTGDIKRLAEPEYVRQCLAQILGHRLALGFVLFVFVVPVGRLRGVEDDGDMRWRAFFDNGEQGVGEGKNGRSVHALRGQAWVADQREVAPIGQRHAIEQEENFFAHAGFFRRAQTAWLAAS